MGNVLNTAPSYEKLAGRYHWRRELTGGGGSRLHLGWDPAFRRQVVVEVFSKASLGEHGRKRFMERVALLEDLDSPRIVRVLDGGVRDGSPFVVWRFPGDDSLDRRLERGPLPAEDALATVRQVAKVLEHAHERGVVHGRLGPECVVFDRKGRAVLWGFAPIPARTGPGTPGAAYRSPESRAGHEPGPASDVYSLAALAYRLLSGATPPLDAAARTAGRLGAALAAVGSPATNRAVAAVLAKALHEHPSERYAGPRLFARALRAAFEGGVPEEAPAPTRNDRRPHRFSLAVAGVLAVAAVGVALAVLLRGGDAGSPPDLQPAGDGSAAPGAHGGTVMPSSSTPGTAEGLPSTQPTQVVAGTREAGEEGATRSLADLACGEDRWQEFSVAEGTRLFPNETACRFAFTVGSCPLPGVILGPAALPPPGTDVVVTWQPGCQVTGYTLEITLGDQESRVLELAPTAEPSISLSLPANATDLRVRLTSHFADPSIHWSYTHHWPPTTP